MKIIPAPLNYSIQDCVNTVTNLSPYFKTFQIDVQDGKYIKNKTITLEEYLQAFAQTDKKIIQSSTFDFHLQTITYEDEVKILSTRKDDFKIGRILIHYSLKPDLQKLKQDYPYFSIGLVLNPEDSVKRFQQLYSLDSLDAIQIMSVHPGPQGTQFIPETLNKIDQLRKYNYRNKILLDGGINEHTIPLIMDRKNQPDILCIGSFITKESQNIKDRMINIKELKLQ